MYGDHGVVVVEVPRQWGKDGLFEGGKETIMCRSVVVRLFQNLHETKFTTVNSLFSISTLACTEVTSGI